jgi:hypothetical protein
VNKMSLAEDLALAAGLRQRLAELERGIKTESAKLNKSAEPWDPNANRAQYAAAQSRADSVAAAFGQSAPPPMGGEGLLEYRVRLANSFKRFSKNIQDIDLNELAASSPKAFSNLESDVYNDAMAYASSPSSVPALQLREVVKSDQSGRKIHEFVGDPGAWMNRFMSPPMKVTRIKTPGWEADALRNAARAVR